MKNISFKNFFKNLLIIILTVFMQLQVFSNLVNIVSVNAENGNHIVKVIGARTISSSAWNSETGGEVDAASGTATVIGDYNKSSGVGLSIYVNEQIDSITFEYDGYEIEISGDNLDWSSNKTFFMNNTGELLAKNIPDENDIIKYYHGKDSLLISVRFYKITSDITITINKVTAKFDNSENAATGFSVDVVTANTEVDLEDYSFTVPSSDLKGVNANSVRMKITPDFSRMAGLILSDGINEYEYRPAEGNVTKDIDGFGKFVIAYNSTYKVYFVRFLYLYKDAIVKPILLSKFKVNNAFNSEGNPVATESAAFVYKDLANATVSIEKGYSNQDGAALTVYTSYGVVSGVNFKIGSNTVALSKEELISETETKIIYIDASGNKSDTAGDTDVLSIKHVPGAKYFNVVLYNVNSDIDMSISYEDIKVTYIYNDTTYLVQNIAFNSKANRPADPEDGELAFDNWYKENTYVNLFNFNVQLKEDTTIYGKYKSLHTLRFIGAGSKTANPISTSEWVDRTSGTFDVSGTATVIGDYISGEGAAIGINTSIGTPTEITIEYNGYKVILTGNQVTGSTTTNLYLSDTGTVSGTSNPDTNVMRYVHNGNVSAVVIRFYKVTSDINVTVKYSDVKETVTATFDNSSNAASAFSLDAQTVNTEVEASSFTVPSSDLKGDNNNSVRMVITPNPSLMVGLILSDGINEYEYRYGDSAVATWYDGIGKVAMAYYNGVYFVRFLYLLKDVTVKPIVVDFNKSFKVNLDSSEDLTVTYDKNYPSAIGVSNDAKIVDVPAGTLPSSEIGESFRWNLGSTIGSDFEYYKIEIIDQDETDEMKKVIATLGEEFVSYKLNANQLSTFQSPNGISVRYNKSSYGEAQLRFWGVTKNILIKVYYKNYLNNQVVTAENAVFNINYDVKIDIETDKVNGYFDYVTENTVVSGNTATVPAIELTGDNTTISQDAAGIITSNVLRLRIAELGKYAVESVTVSDGITTKTFTNNENYLSTLGNIVFVRYGGMVLIRFNKIYTDKTITVSATYSQRPDGPYKVALESDKALAAVSDNQNPKSIKVGINSLSITVPEGALSSDKTGESFLWYLSSTAGMGYEYSKIEIYNTDTSEMLGTIGANFESYLEAADTGQVAGFELPGIKVRYFKSAYGEAQIRVWGVYANIRIVVYYKNYLTGDEYAANDVNLKLNYKGIVYLRAVGLNVEATSKGPITYLDDYRKIRFNKHTVAETGVRYVMKPTKLGARIEYVLVTVGNKSYKVGQGTDIQKVVGKVLPGVKVRFYRNLNGGAIVRVWGVTQNVVVTPVVSYGNRATITIDVGEYGEYRITDIPSSAKINPEVNKITVLQGSTNNSKTGNKTSVAIAVNPKPGYEVDYITFTVGGKTYKLDSKTLKSGTSLMVKIAPGCAIRYNSDSNGNTQIRFVHVDKNTILKVYYRSKTYTVNVNNQQLSKMRAEGYGESYETEFTENFAVAKIISGTTIARQNGIKYWIVPIGEHDITSIVVENSYGDYVICGLGFEDTQYADYVLKGITLRYYKGHNGMAEIRMWAVKDDINITVFYDGETPKTNTPVPEDIGTYDVGKYDSTLPYDNMALSRALIEPKSEKESGNNLLMVGGLVAVAGIISLILKKQKRKSE